MGIEKPETIQDLRKQLENHRRNASVLPDDMSWSLIIEIQRIEKRLAELERNCAPPPEKLSRSAISARARITDAIGVADWVPWPRLAWACWSAE